MTLKDYMGEIWQHRYGSLIWWVAARYFVIGLEYLFGDKQSVAYWLFGGVPPWLVGLWMTFVGLCGIHSRLICRDGWNQRASWLTKIFAAGVCVHSFFRIAMFIQSGLIGDPLVVLFAADLIAMFFVLVQVLRAHRLQCSA